MQLPIPLIGGLPRLVRSLAPRQRVTPSPSPPVSCVWFLAWCRPSSQPGRGGRTHWPARGEGRRRCSVYSRWVLSTREGETCRNVNHQQNAHHAPHSQAPPYANKKSSFRNNKLCGFCCYGNNTCHIHWLPCTEALTWIGFQCMS